MADTQDVICLPITPLPTFPDRAAYARGVAALRKAWKRVWRLPAIACDPAPRLPARDEDVLGAFFTLTRDASGVVTLNGLVDSGNASTYALGALGVLAPTVTPGAIGFLDTSTTEAYGVVVDALGARARQLVPAPE